MKDKYLVSGDYLAEVAKDRRGAVLISLLITIVFLTALGLSLVTSIYSRSIEVNVEIDRLKALYLAEAGIASAVHEMKIGIDLDQDGLGNIKSKRLGDGVYEVRHYYKDSLIISKGTVNSIQRVLQIKYSTS
ncbi:MAG: hypothetical protein V1872_05945 [bacterium]